MKLSYTGVYGACVARVLMSACMTVVSSSVSNEHKVAKLANRRPVVVRRARFVHPHAFCTHATTTGTHKFAVVCTLPGGNKT